MLSELKPCPFCGGDAELDTMQPYRNFVSGQIESAVAVFCRDCSVQISVCVPDVPDITPEQVVEMWNRREDMALRNCQMLAARNRNEEWAKHILRFCSDAGIKSTPLRAIESAARAGQWQPIETAPKDGDEIILRNASWNRVLAHWMPGGHCIEDHPSIDAGWYFWTGNRYDVFKTPEVWRHAYIPTPAAQEE